MSIGEATPFHPDFGSQYGIPYTTAEASTRNVSVAFDYADESDPGPFPTRQGAPVEQGTDAHVFNLDADLPPVIVVPAGATSATFTVRTHLSNGVAASVDEIIVGSSFGTVFQGAYLTITRQSHGLSLVGDGRRRSGHQ